MLIYTIIIGLTLIVMVCLNAFVGIPLYEYDGWYCTKIILLSIASVIAIDGLCAFIIHKLPSKLFNHRFKIFHIFKFERRFYELIRIKKWKDLIPELGGLADFRKNKLAEPTNNEYVEKFLTECCYGEVIHFNSIILGFLIIFFDLRHCLFFGIPVAIANAIINFLSYMILRYNRPKLNVLYERNRRMAERSKKNLIEKEE